MTATVRELISAGAIALGTGLLVLMVTTEGEPGALPLELILVGAIGYGLSWKRGRSADG